MNKQLNPASGFLRVSGFSAVGFAAIILLINLLVLVPAGMPTTGADIAVVTPFFATNSGVVALASIFLPVGWLLAVIFAAGAHAAMQGSEGSRNDAWSLVGLAGVISQNLTIVGVSAIRLALASTSPSDELAAGFWALHDALFTLNGTFLAMALLGLSLGGYRAGIIARWHAVLGLVAAVLQFTSAMLTPFVMTSGGILGLIGLAGWLLWVVWLVFYGVVLIRMGRARVALTNQPSA